MKRLIEEHCKRVHLRVCDYFRIAHYWRFHRLLQCESFREDIIKFEDAGVIPEYVQDYIASRISEPHLLIG